MAKKKENTKMQLTLYIPDEKKVKSYDLKTDGDARQKVSATAKIKKYKEVNRWVLTDSVGERCAWERKKNRKKPIMYLRSSRYSE